MAGRLLPLIGMFAFIAIAFAWRGWVQYRRYGNWGIVLFRTAGWRRHVRDGFFVLLYAALTVQTFVFAAAPHMLSTILIATPPAWAIWIGSSLLFGGLLLTVAAQLGMGASWRIGIDDKAAPGLVTAGLYQFCRNPIYLGLLASFTGLTVLLPTWLSLVLFVGVVWCIRTQVIEEESYLRGTYGQEFAAYASRIGRFLPGLGKLPFDAARDRYV